MSSPLQEKPEGKRDFRSVIRFDAQIFSLMNAPSLTLDTVCKQDKYKDLNFLPVFHYILTLLFCTAVLRNDFDPNYIQ